MTIPPDLISALLAARAPLLITHTSPDGDAIGSLLGCGYVLRKLGKRPIVACQDRVPPTLTFLPGANRVVAQTRSTSVDLIIALDASDPGRLGEAYSPQRYGKLPLVVIDHHITNTRFGRVNWVEPEASSTAEMIVHLARELDAALDPTIATCLLTGILTDTRGFRTSNTTEGTLQTASALMQAGAPLHELIQRALDTRSTNMIRLWGRVLTTAEFEHGIASATNALDMRADLNNVARPEGLGSFLLTTPEAQISVVFTEQPENKVECSFRAVPGYDVSQLALRYGGGGHPLASGCTIDGALDAVRQEVLTQLRTLRKAGAG